MESSSSIKRKTMHGKPHQFKFPLGKEVYLTTGIYKNKMPVHIRKFGYSNETGRPFPTPLGVCMNKEEFEKLISFVKAGNASTSQQLTQWRTVARNKEGFVFMQHTTDEIEMEMSVNQMKKAMEK